MQEFSMIESVNYKLDMILENPLSLSVFSIHIPRNILIGEITRNASGRVPDEAIYGTQNVPLLDVWCSRVANYYNKYVRYNDAGEMMSKVFSSMIQINDDLHGIIFVKCGSWDDRLPFPIKEETQLLRIFKKEKMKMEQQIQERNECIEKMRLRWRETSDAIFQRMRERHVYMQTKMRLWYSERTTLEECMVCFTSMTADTLYIPMCCHFICTSCHQQCSSCPVCRDGFHNMNHEVVHDEDDTMTLLYLDGLL